MQIKVIVIIFLWLINFWGLFLEIISFGGELFKTGELITYTTSSIILYLFVKVLFELKNKVPTYSFLKVGILGLLCLPALYFVIFPWFNAVLSLKGL